MNKEDIKNTLIKRGYSKPNAENVSTDLLAINTILQPYLKAWLDNGLEKDYACDGFSIKGFMNEYDMTYPAALLSINWILEDPETAISLINKGIK